MAEEVEEKKQEESLSDLLGMEFKEDGSWSAKDVGKAPVFRKLNRKERRTKKALSKKSAKK